VIVSLQHDLRRARLPPASLQCGHSCAQMHARVLDRLVPGYMMRSFSSEMVQLRTSAVRVMGPG
jgi:hypothetical protein